MEHKNRFFSWNQFIALLSFVVVLGIVAAGVLWIADDQSSVAIQFQVRLAQESLEVRKEQLYRGAADYGYWDEAVTNIVDKPDPVWEEGNIGFAAYDSFSADMAFVLNPSGQSGYSMVDRHTVSASADALLGPEFKIALARWHHQWGATDRSIPPPYATVIEALGVPMIVAFAPVRPNADTTRPPTTGYSIVFCDRIDGAMMDALSKTYLLPGLRLCEGIPHDADPRASFLISSPTGKAPLYLLWTPQRPGDRVLYFVLPGLLVLLVLVMGMTWIWIRRLGTSERRAYASELMANHDGLTGLPNRNFVYRRIREQLQSGKATQTGLCVMFVDLDEFKAVNDTYGHQAGDDVLCEVANRLKALIRGQDFVGRIGGDEFIVVLQGSASEEVLLARAETLRNSIGRPYELPFGTASISASIGLAMGPRDGSETDQLVRNADAAAYRSKSSGKNRVTMYSQA